MEIPLEKRYRQVHLGHCAYILPEERRFVTENLIRSTGGAGWHYCGNNRYDNG